MCGKISEKGQGIGLKTSKLNPFIATVQPKNNKKGKQITKPNHQSSSLLHDFPYYPLYFLSSSCLLHLSSLITTLTKLSAHQHHHYSSPIISGSSPPSVSFITCAQYHQCSPSSPNQLPPSSSFRSITSFIGGKIKGQGRK